MKISFWTDPEGFSIVDAIAIAFTIVYLFILVYSIFSDKPSILGIVDRMNAPIMVILGGYFTGQTVQQYNISKGPK